MESKKKFFITKEIKIWNFIDILIIGGIILYSIINIFINNNEWSIVYANSKDLISNILWTIILLLVLFINSIPWIAVYIGIRYSITKYNKSRTTFNIELDLLYYREKFPGISPATISLLMDLNLEKIKDLSAMKLYYELHHIYLYKKDNKLEINNPNNIKLNKSDEILLNHFYHNKNDNNILKEWKENVICECIDNNLIIRKNNKKIGCGPFLWINILCFIFMILFAINFEAYREFIDLILANAKNNLDIITIISKNSNYIYMIIMLLFFAISSIIYMYSFISFIINLFVSIFISTKDNLKRTKEGNILTEKLQGMKKFIHDFSNLDEVSKKQLVLWEDFLIYAVVLEENETILKEISNLYNLNILNYLKK